MSKLEDELAQQLDLARIPYEREYQAIKGRKLRWDFYFFPDLLVEVQGGIWRKGGHTTGTGIERDCEKVCLATLAGFRQLLVTGKMIESGQALRFIQGAVK